MTIMNGYLTYTLSALAIIGLAAGYFLGTVDGSTAIGGIWTALAVFGIRRAIS